MSNDGIFPRTPCPDTGWNDQTSNMGMLPLPCLSPPRLPSRSSVLASVDFPPHIRTYGVAQLVPRAASTEPSSTLTLACALKCSRDLADKHQHPPHPAEVFLPMIRKRQQPCLGTTIKRKRERRAGKKRRKGPSSHPRAGYLETPALGHREDRLVIVLTSNFSYLLASFF